MDPSAPGEAVVPRGGREVTTQGLPQWNCQSVVKMSAGPDCHCPVHKSECNSAADVTLTTEPLIDSLDDETAFEIECKIA